MAKLYTGANGSFYDAFGGKLGETEEVWLGDSFERNNTIATAYCSYDNALACDSTALTASSVTKGTVDGVINKIALNGKNYTIGVDTFELESTVSTLTDRLSQLEAQINTLKKHQTVTSELRLALKTLQYKREVE